MSDSCRLLQVTDTHLYTDSSTVKNGLQPKKTLQRVLDTALSDGQFDGLLATGDLAQEATQETYEQFDDLIRSCFDGPVLTVPGNHDIGLLFAETLPTAALEFDRWTVIGLDTHVDNEVGGHVKMNTLAMLETDLKATQKHVLLTGHHPLISVHADWLDSHMVDNSEEVLSVLRSHDHIRAYLCGHVHQENDEVQDKLRFLTTPSTCWQFARRSENFGLDEAPPGWRTLNLMPDGTIDTEVHRLTN